MNNSTTIIVESKNVKSSRRFIFDILEINFQIGSIVFYIFIISRDLNRIHYVICKMGINFKKIFRL